MNDVYVYLLDPHVTQKIYTDANKHHSKPQLLRNVFARWAPTTINFQATADADYKSKRKVLSGAFFKSKTPFIIDIIKQVSIQHLRETAHEEIFDLPSFTNDLQARIIANISVGRKSAKTLIAYEQKDGSIIQLTLGAHFDNMTNDLMLKFT